jgi:hypothetical protein
MTGFMSEHQRMMVHLRRGYNQGENGGKTHLEACL